MHTHAYANINTHCQCVSLSGQIRKRDIIFFGGRLGGASVYLYAHRQSRRLCLCQSVYACVFAHYVCSLNANVISVLMTFSTFVDACVFLQILGWYPEMCNYCSTATCCLFISFLTMAASSHWHSVVGVCVYEYVCMCVYVCLSGVEVLKSCLK